MPDLRPEVGSELGSEKTSQTSQGSIFYNPSDGKMYYVAIQGCERLLSFSDIPLLSQSATKIEQTRESIDSNESSKKRTHHWETEYTSPVSIDSNHSVFIGEDCLPSPFPGRLCFGSRMESPHESRYMPNGGIPEGYLKIMWNGVLYYVPSFTSIP
jgi:hypothetical protein